MVRLNSVGITILCVTGVCGCSRLLLNWFVFCCGIDGFGFNIVVFAWLGVYTCKYCWFLLVCFLIELFLRCVGGYGCSLG